MYEKNLTSSYKKINEHMWSNYILGCNLYYLHTFWVNFLILILVLRKLNYTTLQTRRNTIKFYKVLSLHVKLVNTTKFYNKITCWTCSWPTRPPCEWMLRRTWVERSGRPWSCTGSSPPSCPVLPTPCPCKTASRIRLSGFFYMWYVFLVYILISKFRFYLW